MRPSDFARSSPREVRELIRSGLVDLPATGMCLGHVQTHLAVVPKDLA